MQRELSCTQKLGLCELDYCSQEDRKCCRCRLNNNKRVRCSPDRSEQIRLPVEERKLPLIWRRRQLQLRTEQIWSAAGQLLNTDRPVAGCLPPSSNFTVRFNSGSANNSSGKPLACGFGPAQTTTNRIHLTRLTNVIIL